MSIVHVDALLAAAELDTDTTFAVVRGFSGSPDLVGLAFQMFCCPREAIRMSVLVLHAVLTYEGEARAFLIFRRPGIVEAVSIAVCRLDSLYHTPRSRSLHNCAPTGVCDVDNRCASSTRVYFGWISAVRHRRRVLELVRDVIRLALCVWAYGRPDERERGVEVERELASGAFWDAALRGRCDLCCQGVGKGSEGGVWSSCCVGEIAIAEATMIVGRSSGATTCSERKP